MSLREMVYDALRLDSELNTLGFNTDNIYPAWSRDSTPETVEGNQFLVIRWGTKEPGVSVVIPQLVDLWAYNKEPYFELLVTAHRRMRLVMAGLVARPVDLAQTGWVVGVEWQGAGPDGFDEGYKAHYISENYRLTASGN
jgi:hypothetical protein